MATNAGDKAEQARGKAEQARGKVAGGVGAHQHRDPPIGIAGAQRGGDLGQGGVEDRDVIDHCARPGLAWAQQLGQWLPGPAGAVIGEGQQRVEPDRR